MKEIGRAPAVLSLIPGAPRANVGYNFVQKNALAEEDIRRERETERRLAANWPEGGKERRFHVNPYNKANHQFVSGKVLGREDPNGKERPNEEFLESTARSKRAATEKFDLPQTSSQEIGWFTKTVKVTEFRQDPRVNHPLRHSELSQYMSTFWKNYPSDPNLLRGATNPGGTKRQPHPQ